MRFAASLIMPMSCVAVSHSTSAPKNSLTKRRGTIVRSSIVIAGTSMPSAASSGVICPVGKLSVCPFSVMWARDGL